MIVKIMSLKEGVKITENCLAIKIKSEKYNLLILENHAPLIGEIKGSIEITQQDNTISLENINGYYMNLNNTFKLLLRD
ncbi:MAG: hypothetical protein PUD34_03805 [bacterium]|nr:hypothetical protein [bacterium]